jgi:hypothetical protein
MEKELSLGVMVENTKEITMMTRNKDMAFLLGQMVEDTKDTG